MTAATASVQTSEANQLPDSTVTELSEMRRSARATTTDHVATDQQRTTCVLENTGPTWLELQTKEWPCPTAGQS